jgi:RNA polymerase-binding transcription factor DksA
MAIVLGMHDGRRRIRRRLLIHLEKTLRDRRRELYLQLRDSQVAIDAMSQEAAEAQTIRYRSFAGMQRRCEAQLGAVVAALTRIRTDQYGICAACRASIDHGRLSRIPEAELCATCQWRAESASPGGLRAVQKS